MKKTLIIINTLCVIFSSLFTIDVNANPKWSIETIGKDSSGISYSTTTLTKFNGGFDKNINWRISKVAYSNAKKDGYRKLVFNIEKLAPTDFSQEEVDHLYKVMKNDNNSDYGLGWFTIVDGISGYALTNDFNDYNVKCKHSDIMNISTTAEYTSDRKSYYPYQWATTYTIVYPSEYDDLCIALGGYNHLGKSSKSDRQFLNGKISFGDSDYYNSGAGFYKIINISNLK